MRQPKNQQFIRLTRIMNDFKEILKSFKISFKLSGGSSSSSLGFGLDLKDLGLNFW